MDSILTSIKKLLGIEEDYTHFDEDIIMDINSALMVVNQLGVGPVDGFLITSKTETWLDFIGDRKDMATVKSFIHLKVKLLFDPPTSSFVLDSINRQINEFEWRINTQTDKIIVEGEVVSEY